MTQVGKSVAELAMQVVDCRDRLKSIRESSRKAEDAAMAGESGSEPLLRVKRAQAVLAESALKLADQEYQNAVGVLSSEAVGNIERELDV